MKKAPTFVKKHLKKICSVPLIVAAIWGGVHYSDNSTNTKINGIDVSTIKVDTSKLSINGNKLRISQDAMLIIGDAEGCRQDPYLCPAGVWTVGIGSTNSVVRDQNIDLTEVANRFYQNLMGAQNCIEEAENKIGEEVPQWIFDPMSSLIFNMGCTKVKKYTIYKQLLAKNYKGACQSLPNYSYAGKTFLPGLHSRRLKEQALCINH